MKIALGMIVKSLESSDGIMRFIESAEKYGHKLDAVIVAYALRLDPRIDKQLRQRTGFYPIDIKRPEHCMEAFARLGISGGATDTLLKCPIAVDLHNGKVPYGFNRTVVTIEAILRGVDILFFADSDVYPSALVETPDGPILEEVDFFGEHLRFLGSGSDITTGDYSGYNILPPASFDGMADLLNGLQKADMLRYWETSGAHKCLAFRPPLRTPVPCDKILGGNTAIKLSAFSVLPPFFSSYYTVGGELFLCRGEDTVLGLSFAENGAVCTDIGLCPMHDTFGSYPEVPDLAGSRSAQERFYYACSGWIGRNPFLNYLRGADLAEARDFQRGSLERGLSALAAYTSNPRYAGLLRNFEESWNSLDRYVREYERALEAWAEFRERSVIV